MREVIASVLQNKEIAEEVFSLTVSTGEEIKVRAGQFCMLGVKGFPLRRPIAICKAEGKEITVCYRLKGEGTHALSKLKSGETLPVLLPLGNGFFVEEKETKVALVGGGVGIFPLISVIGQYSGKKEIRAYMGFRNEKAICMTEGIKKGASLVIATDDGSVGFHGTAVAAFEKDFDSFGPDVVLSCGPTPMLKALKAVAAEKGVPTFVSLEERMGCGIGACLVCVCDQTNGKKARVCKDGPVFEIDEVEI